MTLDLDLLARELRAFRSVRDWERFHTPKNLAMALAAEAGELLEEFQWLTPDESIVHASSAGVADEVADVLIYLVQLADAAGIDLGSAVSSKMARNEARFPPL